MTEAEALEVAGIWGGHTLTAFTVFISFTFAYLVTVFYVGARLDAFQAIAASALYVFAATSAILAQIGYMQSQFKILAEVPNTLDDLFLVTAGEFWIPYMAFMQFAGVVMGVYFMWSVRRHSASK